MSLLRNNKEYEINHIDMLQVKKDGADKMMAVVLLMLKMMMKMMMLMLMMMW